MLPRPPVCFTSAAVKKKDRQDDALCHIRQYKRALTSLSTSIQSEYSENNKKRGKLNLPEYYMKLLSFTIKVFRSERLQSC
jgi:hypothetical protein